VLSTKWEVTLCLCVKKICILKDCVYTELQALFDDMRWIIIYNFWSYMRSSSPPCVLHALTISSSLTLSFKLYLAKRTSYEAPHFAVFSNLLSPPPSVCILSWAPCTQMSTGYVSPLNVKDQVSHWFKSTGKTIVLYALIFIFYTARKKTKGSELNDRKHYQNSLCSWFPHE
jgi:hypothetical protein